MEEDSSLDNRPGGRCAPFVRAFNSNEPEVKGPWERA